MKKPQPLSACCGKNIITVTSTESAGYYQCSGCNKKTFMRKSKFCYKCNDHISRYSTSGLCKSCVLKSISENKGIRRSRSESKMGEKNVNWKGDAVGYTALHGWVRRRLPKPDLCRKCQTEKPYDLANISQEYKRDLSDWEWLCRRCHMNSDGRMNNLYRKRRLIEIHCSICAKKFHPKRVTGRFCSKSCAKTFRNLNRIGVFYE